VVVVVMVVVAAAMVVVVYNCRMYRFLPKHIVFFAA
jgi:hypothetical protein